MSSLMSRSALRSLPKLERACHTLALGRAHHLQRILCHPSSRIGLASVHQQFALYNVSAVSRKIEYENNNIEEVLKRYFTKLEADLRDCRRVQKFELENLLRLIDKSGECSFNQAMQIIRSCAMVVDINNAERAELLNNCIEVLRGFSFDISHYNAILKVQ